MHWLIHHVAYVENLNPLLTSNLSHAFISPSLPSWIKSRKSTPLPTLLLAIDTTNLRLWLTIFFFNSIISSSILANSSFVFSSCVVFKESFNNFCFSLNKSNFSNLILSWVFVKIGYWAISLKYIFTGSSKAADSLSVDDILLYILFAKDFILLSSICSIIPKFLKSDLMILSTSESSQSYISILPAIPTISSLGIIIWFSLKNETIDLNIFV